MLLQTPTFTHVTVNPRPTVEGPAWHDSSPPPLFGFFIFFYAFGFLHSTKAWVFKAWSQGQQLQHCWNLLENSSSQAPAVTRCLISSGVRPGSRCSNAWTTLKTTTPDWALQKSQERSHQLPWGHRPASVATDALGRGKPRSSSHPWCPAGAPLAHFLASEEPSGWGVRARAGQSAGVTLGAIPAAPRQPSGPPNPSPNAKML